MRDLRGSPGGDEYHSIWVNPKDPKHIAEGSDQGAAVSVNGSRTWSSWYNQPTGQFYHLAADNRFPYWVYSGQQDSGTVAIASRSDYGAPNMRDWHPVGGDERDYDIPDPVDPNIVYGSGLGGRVAAGTHAPARSPTSRLGRVQNYGLRPTLVAHHFNWVSPIAFSRAGRPRLYLGGECSSKPPIAGQPGTIISPDLTGKRPGAKNCGGDVTSRSHRPAATAPSLRSSLAAIRLDEIWAGSDNGHRQRHRATAEPTGRNVTLDGIAPWSQDPRIDLSPLDPATAYVAVDGQRMTTAAQRLSHA